MPKIEKHCKSTVNKKKHRKCFLLNFLMNIQISILQFQFVNLCASDADRVHQGVVLSSFVLGKHVYYVVYFTI